MLQNHFNLKFNHSTLSVFSFCSRLVDWSETWLNRDNKQQAFITPTLVVRNWLAKTAMRFGRCPKASHSSCTRVSPQSNNLFLVNMVLAVMVDEEKGLMHSGLPPPRKCSLIMLTQVISVNLLFLELLNESILIGK